MTVSHSTCVAVCIRLNDVMITFCLLWNFIPDFIPGRPLTLTTQYSHRHIHWHREIQTDQQKDRQGEKRQTTRKKTQTTDREEQHAMTSWKDLSWKQKRPIAAFHPRDGDRDISTSFTRDRSRDNDRVRALTQSAEVLSDVQAVPLVRDGLQHVLQGLVRLAGVLVAPVGVTQTRYGGHNKRADLMTRSQRSYDRRDNNGALHFRQLETRRVGNTRRWRHAA